MPVEPRFRRRSPEPAPPSDIAPVGLPQGRRAREPRLFGATVSVVAPGYGGHIRFGEEGSQDVANLGVNDFVEGRLVTLVGGGVGVVMGVEVAAEQFGDAEVAEAVTGDVGGGRF